jgi:hypothetical protein
MRSGERGLYLENRITRNETTKTKSRCKVKDSIGEEESSPKEQKDVFPKRLLKRSREERESFEARKRAG